MARYWTLVLAFGVLALPAAAREPSGFGDRGWVAFRSEALLPLAGGDIVVGERRAGGVHLRRLAPDGADRGLLPTGPLFPCRPAKCGRLVLAVDARGRVLVAGGSYVARVLPSGRRDLTFGERGLAILPSFVPVTGIAPAGSGEVWVAGPGRLGRLRVDGSVVPVVGLEEGFEQPRGPVVEPDGSVVLAGCRNRYSSWIMRFRADGEPDFYYGRSAEAVGQGMGFCAAALALQPDGKVLVAAVLEGGRVVRLRRDGVPDPSFGVDGVSRASWPASVRGLGVQPGGTIVVGAEYALYTKSSDWVVYRLAANGNLLSDRYLGDLDPDDDCWFASIDALVVQRDGKVLTSGEGCKRSGLVRLLPNAVVEDVGSGLDLRRVPGSSRPVALRRQGTRWVATLQLAPDYPAELTLVLRRASRRGPLPLLAGSSAGRTALTRLAHRLTTPRAAGPTRIRLVLPAAAAHAGARYVLTATARDARGREAALTVRLAAA